MLRVLQYHAGLGSNIKYEHVATSSNTSGTVSLPIPHESMGVLPRWRNRCGKMYKPEGHFPSRRSQLYSVCSSRGGSDRILISHVQATLITRRRETPLSPAAPHEIRRSLRKLDRGLDSHLFHCVDIIVRWESRSPHIAVKLSYNGGPDSIPGSVPRKMSAL